MLSDMLIASFSLTRRNKNLKFSQITPAKTHSVTFQVPSIKLTKFAPDHALKVHRSSGGTAPLILNLGTGWERVVRFTSPPLYLQERTSIPLV